MSIDKKAEDLLLKIARCPEICKAKEDDSHPCSKIVKTQEQDGHNSFQLPEPWNGDLVNSKILFISSNPSINHNEKYPYGDWDDQTIKDFFQNRFSEERQWVKGYKYPQQKDGTYPAGKYWVRFWASVRSIAKTILEDDDVTPGKDYSLTEIVHCKSISEKGVSEALKRCSKKYLDDIIELSNAKYIVSLGKFSANFFREKYTMNNDEVIKKIADKYLIILPHPNARVKRMEKLLQILDEIKKK